MNNVIYILLQVFVIVLAAPLVKGIIAKVKAFSQKRRGAPVLQQYYDLFKLFRKTAVVSDVSSWIYRAAPYIVFATSAAAAVLVPVSVKIVPEGLPGDMIMLVYILALGRFFMMLAALDTGSTFGGMGSSREAMISSLIEPSILVTLFTAGLIAKSTSLFNIMGSASSSGHGLPVPVYIMLFFALLVAIIAETSRIPVDDPATHLELTMVHEAMILEYSGRHLALMELGASVKQLVLMTLLVNVFIPTDQLISIAGAGGVIISLAVYLLKIILVSLLIAVAEVSTVKFRLFSVPNIAALAFILAFLGFLQYFVLGR